MPTDRFQKLLNSDKRADERERGLSWNERRDQTAYEHQQQGYVNQLYDAHHNETQNNQASWDNAAWANEQYAQDQMDAAEDAEWANYLDAK